MIDVVSETTRLCWNDVYALNVQEFVHYVAYAAEKNRRREKRMEEWRRKH